MNKLASMSEFKIYRKFKERLIQNGKNSNDSLRNIECNLAFKFWQFSGKLKVLMNFLQDWHKDGNPQGNKVLLFSQTKKMLDIIELLAQKFQLSYLRMDGEVSLQKRIELIDKFNNEPIFLFLLTTRVGGLGINLKSANKVVIFDPDWNPMVDIQATDRALRIGQQRNVAIYRFIVDDTIEEKIFHRQVFKQYMANKILQDPFARKLFEKSSMHELFELPKKTINLRQQEQLMKKLNIPKKSIDELEEEVKQEMNKDSTSDNEEMKDSLNEEQMVSMFTHETDQLQKMYKLTKKNIKKDKNLQEYLEKTQQELEKLDESTGRIKKDMESDLITQIFQQKDEEEEKARQDRIFRSYNMAKINIHIEAKKAARNLIDNLNGGSQAQNTNEQQLTMSSKSILSNLINKNKERELLEKQMNEVNNTVESENDKLVR